jgi:hypothetical protein
VLWGEYRQSELDRNGYPKGSSGAKLIGIVDERGHSNCRWDTFWSSTPANPQEKAWIENRPVYNE